jgi:hypothetical protein
VIFCGEQGGKYSCSYSTARFSNAAIREKVRVLDAEFPCAESIKAWMQFLIPLLVSI